MEALHAFDFAYHALLRDAILPHIDDPNGFAFQRRPAFRCHLPGGKATGVQHCDAEYGHSRAEINFWVPLTRVWGSNSLFSESEPGLGDYKPFDLAYGQVQRFWGNQLQHYTTANETASCRVSFDFRLIPRS